VRKFIAASLIVSIATFSAYLLKSYHVDQTFDGLMGKKTASWGSI